MYEPFSQFLPEPVASGVYEEFMTSAPILKLAMIGVVKGESESEIASSFGIGRRKIISLLYNFRKRVKMNHNV